MSRGLLARLRGEAAERDLARSVALHLHALLNTRRGEAPAAPDYGIPDLADVVHAFPLAIQLLARAIRETIVRYEPRLERPQVRHVPDPADPLTLHFEIVGRIADGRTLKLRTRIEAGGKLDVD